MHSHKNHVFGRDYITITRRIFNGRVDVGHLTAATPAKFVKSFGSATNHGGKLQGQEIVGNEHDLEAKSESVRACVISALRLPPQRAVRAPPITFSVNT